jgi:hypothetical protein
LISDVGIIVIVDEIDLKKIIIEKILKKTKNNLILELIIKINIKNNVNIST